MNVVIANRKSTLSVQPLETKKKEGEPPPFNLRFLAKKFCFALADVEKMESDEHDFTLYFKRGKESVAQAFSQTLCQRGVPWAYYWEHTNSVELSKHQSEYILAAAEVDVSAEEYRVPVFCEKRIIRPDNGKRPFNLRFLAEKFHFSLADVKQVVVDGGDFTIYFHDGKEYIAQEFSRTLIERGVLTTSYLGFDNTVQLWRHYPEENIMAAAEVDVSAEEYRVPVFRGNRIISPDDGIAPFNLRFLADKYHFSLSDVKEVVEGKRSFCIYFKCDAQEAAKELANNLARQKEQGVVCSYYWDFDNSVELVRDC